jgi:hypothetical protein
MGAVIGAPMVYTAVLPASLQPRALALATTALSVWVRAQAGRICSRSIVVSLVSVYLMNLRKSIILLQCALHGVSASSVLVCLNGSDASLCDVMCIVLNNDV